MTHTTQVSSDLVTNASTKTTAPNHDGPFSTANVEPTGASGCGAKLALNHALRALRARFCARGPGLPVVP